MARRQVWRQQKRLRAGEAVHPRSTQLTDFVTFRREYIRSVRPLGSGSSLAQ